MYPAVITARTDVGRSVYTQQRVRNKRSEVTARKAEENSSLIAECCALRVRISGKNKIVYQFPLKR
jgi:hypothetical protein